MKTGRDEGRIKKAVAGAHQRAATKLAQIDAARRIAIEKDELARAMGQVLEHPNWPRHAMPGHVRAPFVPSTPIEGQARMARARQRVGIDLDDNDRAAIERVPEPDPDEDPMRQAMARYRADVAPPDRSETIATLMERSAALRRAAHPTDT